MSELQDAREAGWRPERASDWPTLVDPDASPDSAVERGGQRLYGRPIHLTMEARQEDFNVAQEQQNDRMNAAAAGKSARRNEEGIPTGRAVRVTPGNIVIEGVAG